MRRGKLILGVAVVVAQLLIAGAAVGKTWTMGGSKDFSQGKLDGVSIRPTGELELGPVLEQIEGLKANYVWDIEVGAKGKVYVGTGAPATVGVLTDKGFKELHRTSEKHVMSVLLLKDGSVLAATAPRGIIYRIDARGKVTVFKELGESYVWEMAIGAKGEIYCATGPNGRLLKLSARGEVKELFKASQKHLMCMAVDPKGDAIFVGTAPDGLIYRVAADGKASVLYDAEETEVRCLLLAPDGALYAGTAQTGGASGASSPPSRGGPNSGGPRPTSAERNAAGGPGLPSAPPGANSIYRIEPNGAALRLTRIPGTLMLSIVLKEDGQLLAGTGVRGRFVAASQRAGSARVVIDLDATHVSALAADASGQVVLGTSSGGGLWRVGAAHRPEGKFVSKAFDAGYVSRWGRVWWKAVQPSRTDLEVSVRTGNSREPDGNWSEWWSPPTSRTDGAALKVPMGRFAQVRCTLQTRDAGASPALIELSVSYRQVNRPPLITELSLDGAATGGSERPAGPTPPKAPATKRKITWKTADPNGDRLVFDLYYRGVEEKAWKVLKEKIAAGPRFEWDTARVPDGHYLLRVVASDRLARPAGEALQDEQVSQPFVIDNRRPELADLKSRIVGDGEHVISGLARDGYSTITDLKVSHNADAWVPVFPADGLFDSGAEKFTYRTESLEEGEHVFVFVATDGRGDVGSGKIVITVE